jgi:hypothetical protein
MDRDSASSRNNTYGPGAGKPASYHNRKSVSSKIGEYHLPKNNQSIEGIVFNSFGKSTEFLSPKEISLGIKEYYDCITMHPKPPNWIRKYNIPGRYFDFQKYKKQVEGIQYPFNHLLYDGLGLDLIQELYRFSKCLEWYEVITTSQGINIVFEPQDIFSCCLSQGPEYAEFLGDFFDYSVRFSFGINYIVPEGKKYTKIESYSDIFPSKFLFRWKEDTSDFLLTTQSPDDNEDSEEIMCQLVDVLKESLSGKTFRRVNRDEILLSSLPTMSYSWIRDEKVPHGELDYRVMSDHYRGLRVKVPVTPDGIRDTVILSKDSSNTIRYIEAQCKEILNHFHESPFNTNNSLSSKDLMDNLLNVQWRHGEGYHVLRDIKKAGLTIPIQKIVPYLYQAFLELGFDFKELLIFTRPMYVRNYYDDGPRIIKMDRGSGLGMANHLTTLICILIHRLAIKRISSFESIASYALIGNDDADIFIWDPDRGDSDLYLAELYIDEEHYIFSAIGWHLNLKKTFISKMAVFFEEYGFENFCDKSALLSNIFGTAEICQIRVAKELINAVADYFPDSLINKFVFRLSLMFDYEFYPEEIHYPYKLGGWTSPRIGGLDNLLDNLEPSLLKLQAHAYKVVKLSCIQLEPSKDVDRNATYLGSVLRYKGSPIIIDGIPTVYDQDDKEKYYHSVRIGGKSKRKKFKKINHHIQKEEFIFELLSDESVYIPARFLSCNDDIYYCDVNYVSQFYSQSSTMIRTLDKALNLCLLPDSGVKLKAFPSSGLVNSNGLDPLGLRQRITMEQEGAIGDIIPYYRDTEGSAKSRLIHNLIDSQINTNYLEESGIELLCTFAREINWEAYIRLKEFQINHFRMIELKNIYEEDYFSESDGFEENFFEDEGDNHRLKDYYLSSDGTCQEKAFKKVYDDIVNALESGPIFDPEEMHRPVIEAQPEIDVVEPCIYHELRQPRPDYWFGAKFNKHCKLCDIARDSIDYELRLLELTSEEERQKLILDHYAQCKFYKSTFGRDVSDPTHELSDDESDMSDFDMF